MNKQQHSAKTTAEKRRALLDKAAIALTTTCVLHCLALPVLVSMLPLATLLLIPEQVFHYLMLALILPSSLTALWLGCHKHKDIITLLMGALGICILISAAFWGHLLYGVDGERWATSLGGVSLALAHIRNYLLCQHDDCTHE